MPESFAPVRPNQIGFPGFGRLLSQLLEGAQVHQVWACAFLIALFLAKVSSHEGRALPPGILEKGFALRSRQLHLSFRLTSLKRHPRDFACPLALHFKVRALLTDQPHASIKECQRYLVGLYYVPSLKGEGRVFHSPPTIGRVFQGSRWPWTPHTCRSRTPPAHPPLSTLAFFRSGSNPCCRISQFLCLLF